MRLGNKEKNKQQKYILCCYVSLLVYFSQFGFQGMDIITL